MRSVVSVLVGVALVAWLMSQCRKPNGWLGRFLLWTMNRSHSGLTDWGLRDLPIGEHDTILDVGCGGGRTVEKLALVATGGKVIGVDYSSASVAAARRTNRRSIETGRVEIQQASVSHLPFSDRMFDLVTAVETHYYWPDLAADLREILRVLEPGGRLVIIAEAYHGGRLGPLPRLVMKPMRGKVLSVGELRDLLSSAGYSEVEVREEYEKGWICGIGRRSA